MDTTAIVDQIIQFSSGYQMLFSLIAGVFLYPFGDWLHTKLPGEYTTLPASYKVLLNLALAWGLAVALKEPYTLYSLLAFASMGYTVGSVTNKVTADTKTIIKPKE